MNHVFRCCGLAGARLLRLDLAPHVYFLPRLQDMSSECKPPAISAMTKTQLISECNRLGLVVHRTWTVEELKAVIQEHRMQAASKQPGHQMKAVTSLNMPELKMKATEMGVEFPDNITKGNLLRLIRDSLKTPATELMKIGKYKGFEFQEIPSAYGEWASREVKSSANPHIELVRYAKWWDNEQTTRYTGNTTTIEEDSVVPYPGSESVLVTFADRGVLNNQPGNYSVVDWKSRAGQRVCRSTFGAETQACAEGLETAQYMRSMLESLITGYLITVELAKLPILCLSDCRSLFDHLNKQGIPRVPTDKRLAVDLAALRQALKSEMWSDALPIGWVPGSVQKGDVLTKPQNPAGWWESLGQKLVLPLAIGGGCGLISNRKIRQKTSVKLDSVHGRLCDGIFPFEQQYSHTGLPSLL